LGSGGSYDDALREYPAVERRRVTYTKAAAVTVQEAKASAAAANFMTVAKDTIRA
jgi:hypothetical protein